IRLHRPWKVPTHMPRMLTGVSAESRASISFAALFVNVTPRIDSGVACPVASSHAMRVVSTRVLPLPAPARISADACGSVTASSCSGLRLARSGEDTGTTIIGDRYNPPPHERGPTIRAEGPSRGANCAPWGAAQRRKPQAWGDHIRAEGPSRGANCAPWGAAQRRKPQAWGDHIRAAPDDTPPVNSATMRAFVHWI